MSIGDKQSIEADAVVALDAFMEAAPAIAPLVSRSLPRSANLRGLASCPTAVDAISAASGLPADRVERSLLFAALVASSLDEAFGHPFTDKAVTNAMASVFMFKEGVQGPVDILSVEIDSLGTFSHIRFALPEGTLNKSLGKWVETSDPLLGLTADTALGLFSDKLASMLPRHSKTTTTTMSSPPGGEQWTVAVRCDRPLEISTCSERLRAWLAGSIGEASVQLLPSSDEDMVSPRMLAEAFSLLQRAELLSASSAGSCDAKTAKPRI